MIYVKHDTSKINDCGREIIHLANQYEMQIRNLFNRIQNIEEAWRGEDAKIFVQAISEEENIYMKFGESLKKYGQTLSEVSNDIQHTINKTSIN